MSSIKGKGKQVIQVIGIITRPIMKLASQLKTIVKLIPQKVLSKNRN